MCLNIFKGWEIKSGTISIKADRYYVSVLVEIPNVKITNNSNDGIGVDLGLKNLAIVSNGKTYKNINKSIRIKNNYEENKDVFLVNMKI